MAILTFVSVAITRPVLLSKLIGQPRSRRNSGARSVGGLIGLTKGAYQERFGTSSLTVAVVTTDEHRLAQLRQWTEAELEKLGRDRGDLFRFAVLSEDLLLPEVMFFAPRWYRPFDSSAVTLLERPA